jgi:hypothetical protein
MAKICAWLCDWRRVLFMATNIAVLPMAADGWRDGGYHHCFGADIIMAEIRAGLDPAPF